jgi:hypothetical protein
MGVRQLGPQSKDSDDKADGSANVGSAGRGKALYSKPVVVEHGTLRDITLAVGSKGASDNNAGKGPNKTHK